MGTFYPMAALFVLYVWFVKKAGPRFMENRAAFQLNTLTRAYNLYQTISCAALLVFIPEISAAYHPWRCGVPMTPDEAAAYPVTLAPICWYLIMLRTSELLEGVFFVLRKKQNQVSLLHVFHHTAVISIMWLFVKYTNDKTCGFIFAINTAVHFVMYMWYFASSFQSLKPITTRVKPLLTALQIAQLVAMCTHCVYAIISCEHAPKLYYLMATVIVILIGMFLNFYVKSYRPKPKSN